MYAHLLPHLEKLAGHRVLCIGDLMLDRFVYGDVERISPEAPIPVLRIQRESIALGGAGNVVRNLVALGGQVAMVGVIGDDSAGVELEKRVKALGGITPCLLKDPARPTTTKVRYIAGSQQLLRADHEQAMPVATAVEEKAIDGIRETLDDCDIVILSDYAKGVLTPRVIAETIRMAHENGHRVLVDPKGLDFSRYRGAYILTPNRRELGAATNMPVGTIEETEAAARYLIASCDLHGVLAKLGADGVCLVMKDEPARHFRGTAREVYDVSGAGDTVVATMALALAGGLSLADAAALANLAGSIVVSKIGTASVTHDDLAHELLHDQTHASEEKITNLATAMETVARWRQKGLKTGFTNGVFDLLHPGHLSLIHQARTHCDRLIVGMNSDSSVKRLKGEGRPVQGESARAAVLASLADVDGVVIFGEDTPLHLIKKLRPDVLVKGADYTLDKVVGADLVQGWGGKVVLATLVDGQSTTATIARLKTS